jgi:hypothetical protein
VDGFDGPAHAMSLDLMEAIRENRGTSPGFPLKERGDPFAV